MGLPACQRKRHGFHPWVKRDQPRGGHGNPLQCSCLGNPMDRGACQATVHGVRKSQAWLSDYTTTTKNMSLSKKNAVAEKAMLLYKFLINFISFIIEVVH